MSNGIEESRHRSYKYFSAKKKVTLEFESDERRVAIDGYVESNEPIIFSKDEYTQVSILCLEPYFRSIEPVEVVFTTVDPLDGFEFPFENNSLTEDLIIMGEVKDDKVYNIFYPGDADVGMVITIQAKEPARGIEIYNTQTRERMWLDDDKIFQASGGYIGIDDIIKISTVKGNKYATLQRGVKVYNILNAMGKDSSWIQLTQGDNVLGYNAENGLEFLGFKLEFYVLYEGV